MIEFFVRRPVTTWMFVLVFVVLGIVSFSNIPIEETPKIDFPIVTVTTDFPGATPLEVETLVVNKVEDAVAEISEIDKIRSYSYEGRGIVIVEFLISSDVNIKFIEVKDKVEAIINDLPLSIEKPIIEKFDPLQTPVLELVLSAQEGQYSMRDLYEYADKKLKQRLSGITGVANVDVYGGRVRQINVDLDPMLLKKHYLSIDMVIDAVMKRNQNIPGGLIEKDDSSSSLRFIGEFQQVDDIASMMLTSLDGKSFRLKDIGVVKDGFKKIDSIARFNGEEVVGISLNKASDASAVSVAKSFFSQRKKIEEQLPQGMVLKVANDTTTFITTEVLATEWNIFIGILLTIAILYMFTGQIKLTFIAAIVIPTSIVSTFFLMDASKFSINFITLLGIATALGTLIANAIVIIENVLVHLERGKDAITSAIDGTKEVTAAVIAGAGTNLVVFTPIAFMGGIIGKFMSSFGLTVVYATLFSIFASFTLTPMLCGLLLKNKDVKNKKIFSWKNPFSIFAVWVEKLMVFLLKEYRIIFHAMFTRPLVVVGIVLGLFWAIGTLFPYIDGTFYPASDTDLIVVDVVMPQEATIQKTTAIVHRIEERIKKIPEVESYLSSIGINGVEKANIKVNLMESKKRKRSDQDIINELIPFVARIPDAEINLIRGDGTSSGGGDVSINVFGSDYNKVIDLSHQMKEKMEKSGFFRSVISSYKSPKTEIRFVPNDEKMLFFGVTHARLGEVLRASVYGHDKNTYKEEGEQYDINIKLSDYYLSKDMKDIAIVSSKGLIAVTELGDMIQDKALPMITHRDRQRVITLDGYLSKSSLSYVSKTLNQDFDQMPWEEGYGYKYVGDSELQEESNTETTKAFILSVVLTLMLLCALMNSFFYPLVIISMIATSFLGVFFFLFVFEQSINIASMLAIVMLVGIVVNNAILVLDYTITRLKEGMPLLEAIWAGMEAKFRAVWMTSIAIVLGTLPQMFDPVMTKSSMGTVMIGGVLASILFTFFFVPILFWYVEIFRRKFFEKSS